jgi:O-antigen/teichoic acid export membrane protein
VLHGRRGPSSALLGAPGALLNAIGGLMTPIVIFSLYGSVAAGQYALIDRMLLAPVALLTQTTAQIVVGRLSSSRHEDAHAFRQTFQLVAAAGLAVGIVAAVLVAVLAAPLLLFVFGEPWQAAARIATILAPMFVVIFAAAPVSHTLIIAGKHKQQFGWEILRFCAITVCWSVAAMTTMKLEAALSAYVWTTVAVYAVFLLLSFRASTRIVRGD